METEILEKSVENDKEPIKTKANKNRHCASLERDRARAP